MMPPMLRVDLKAECRILVVDDEPVAQHLLQALFVNAGYSEVDVRDTGERALEAIAEKPYCMVVTDKNLPGISGLEVVRMGRGLQPECAFVLVTAYGSLETAQLALALGAVDYFTKPFPNIHELLDRLERLLVKAVARQQIASKIRSLGSAVQELSSADLADPAVVRVKAIAEELITWETLRREER